MRSPALVIAVGFSAACGEPTDAPIEPDASISADAAATCACSYGAPAMVGTVTAIGATELSGLAWSRANTDLLWTHNDSGDGPRVFAISASGAARGELSIQGATATDWEDIALGPCGAASCLYIADIGDNALARGMVRIYEVDEQPQLGGTASTTARTYEVIYPDGAHNAEALWIDPRDGASYVITKQASNPSTVFRMPRTTGSTATAEAVGTLAIPSGSLLVTGGDLYADACGTRLLVRTPTALFELRGPADATIAQLLTATPMPVPVAAEQQGEAVAYMPDGRGYSTVSEGASPPLWRVRCQ